MKYTNAVILLCDGSVLLLCYAIQIVSLLIMAGDTIQRKAAFTEINKCRHLSLSMPLLISMDAYMRVIFLVKLAAWVAYTFSDMC